MMKKSRTGIKQLPSVLDDEQNRQFAAEAFDKADWDKEEKDYIKRMAKKKKEHDKEPPKEAPSTTVDTGLDEGNAAAEPATSSSSGGDPPGKKKFPAASNPEAGYTNKEVLRLMPPAKGKVTLRHKTFWHLRWRINIEGKGGTSRVHKSTEDEIDAVAYIVQWAWTEYSKTPGAIDCPYDFTGFSVADQPAS